jgi:hypothetical protein
MRRYAIPLLLLLSIGCAADAARVSKHDDSDAKELDKALKGLTPGTLVDCVDTNSLNGPQIIGLTLLYNEAGRVWRTDLEACPGLRQDSLLVIEQVGKRMCEKDRFKVVPRGSSIPGATCWMGKFTPYTKAKKAQ